MWGSSEGGGTSSSREPAGEAANVMQKLRQNKTPGKLNIPKAFDGTSISCDLRQEGSFKQQNAMS